MSYQKIEEEQLTTNPTSLHSNPLSFDTLLAKPSSVLQGDPKKHYFKIIEKSFDKIRTGSNQILQRTNQDLLNLDLRKNLAKSAGLNCLSNNDLLKNFSRANF